MKRWTLGVGMVATVAVLAGCSLGGGPKTVEIQLKDMAFSKKEIALKAGAPVKLVLNNKDTMLHDFSIDEIHISSGTEAVTDEHSHGDRKEPDLHVSAKPGEKTAIIFTPNEAGEYVYYCTVEGHSMAGMKGTLYVTADGKMPKSK